MAKNKKPKIALIMPGGGARAAYQVGVIKAISEIVPKNSHNPFAIICGTSAGAINATTLAAYAFHFREASQRLLRVWRNFHVHQVYRADTLGILLSGAHWLLAMMSGGLGKYNPTSLFNRKPLYQLLNRHLPCEDIQTAIDAGYLEALSVNATGYSSGQSVSFFQGVSTLVPWNRVRRVGCPAKITVNHLMASSAIPFVFPAVRINREFFGDGSMRQMFPISPALHLGAEKVLVIGVRATRKEEEYRQQQVSYPSIGQIAGNVLNSIFLDSVESDLERLERINKTISLIPDRKLRDGTVTLREIEPLVISPSEDIGAIAEKHAHHLPRAIRFLLRGLGAMGDTSASLASYLLFEKPYCRELIDLGYADAMERRDEIRKFLDID